jgi:hypothetical protein
MKQIRNIAITGVDSQEKYDMVSDLVGDKRGIFTSDMMGLVVYDDGDSSSFMAFWDEQSFSRCNLYTYEEFIAWYGEKKCDGKWNGYYIEASQEAYDLLVADGYIDATHKENKGGKYILIGNGKTRETEMFFHNLEVYEKPLYIVDGKLSATQYHPDEVAFKNKPEDFTITEDESFIVGTQYKHLKCDTVEWSKQNHTLEQQKAICQFMLNKYSMREKGQDVDDIVKIKFYVNWLEEIAKAKQ